MSWYQFLRRLCWPLKKYYGVKVLHAHRIPKKGPLILAFNHAGRCDGLLVPMYLDRTIHFFAKKELFSYFGGFIFKITGQIPIDRENGGNERAIKAATGLIGKGEAFGIFPEGTTRGGPKLRTPRRGVARIALATGAPVVPIAILGTCHALPPKEGFTLRLPKRVPMSIIVGKPLSFAHLRGKENDYHVCGKVAQDIMDEIAKLVKAHSTDPLYLDGL